LDGRKEAIIIMPQGWSAVSAEEIMKAEVCTLEEKIINTTMFEGGD
jgi:hypothetical protein